MERDLQNRPIYLWKETYKTDQFFPVLTYHIHNYTHGKRPTKQTNLLMERDLQNRPISKRPISYLEEIYVQVCNMEYAHCEYVCTLRHAAIHCDTLQHVPTRCNTLHHSNLQYKVIFLAIMATVVDSSFHMLRACLIPSLPSMPPFHLVPNTTSSV